MNENLIFTSHLQSILPAVCAAVFLCDTILIVPPNVHWWEDQHHQHGKAAEKGKDGNALLLGLEDETDTNTCQTSIFYGVFVKDAWSAAL